MRCEMCGNDYDKAFEVIAAGERHVFDSFECAIHALAPVCEHCGCKVVGHGVEVNGRFYCCAHCARETAGTTDVRDRVDVGASGAGFGHAEVAARGRLVRGPSRVRAGG